MLYEIADEETFFRIRISDTDDNILYKDGEGFLARFNVYWCWDEEDRVWLYNSDDGKVYCWVPEKDGWVKILWGAGKENQCGLDISPPLELYPDYAK